MRHTPKRKTPNDKAAEKTSGSERLPPDWEPAPEPATAVGPRGAKEIDPGDEKPEAAPVSDHLEHIDHLEPAGDTDDRSYSAPPLETPPGTQNESDEPQALDPKTKRKSR